MIQTSYTIFMMLTATPTWLGQSRKERATFTTTVIQPVLERYANRVQVRFYDAEAFATRCSDFAIFTTDDLQAYAFLMEALRDTDLFIVPYFVVNEVLIGLENGYQAFEEASSVQGTSSRGRSVGVIQPLTVRMKEHGPPRTRERSEHFPPESLWPSLIQQPPGKTRDPRFQEKLSSIAMVLSVRNFQRMREENFTMVFDS